MRRSLAAWSLLARLGCCCIQALRLLGVDVAPAEVSIGAEGLPHAKDGVVVKGTVLDILHAVGRVCVVSDDRLQTV